MAGIGFTLQRAYHPHSLLGRIGAASHAAVIAAGPWLFAIASIAAISWFGSYLTTRSTLDDFRVGMIYAFSISLVLTSPISYTAIRVAADALYLRAFHDIAAIFTAALLLTIVVTAPASVALFAYFADGTFGYVIAASGCTVTVSLVWTAMAFCGALKDFRSITLAFVFGFSVAVFGCLLMISNSFGATGMLLAVSQGLVLTFLLLAGRVLGEFPSASTMAVTAAARRIVSMHPMLALGGLLGAMAIWVDKWVFWTMRGEHAASGLAHAPLYDSAMFIGCLAIIPSLAAFVIHIESVLFSHSRSYLGVLLGHRTLDEIEARREALEDESLRVLHRTLLVQVGVTLIVVLLAPLLAQFLKLQFAQLSIFRMSAMGIGFQFLFFASSAIVAFFDRQLLFLVLQALFLALNFGLTLAFIVFMGPDWDGMGYLAATVASGVVAYFAALHTLKRLTYLIFIGNNRAL